MCTLAPVLAPTPHQPKTQARCSPEVAPETSLGHIISPVSFALSLMDSDYESSPSRRGGEKTNTFSAHCEPEFIDADEMGLPSTIRYRHRPRRLRAEYSGARLLPPHAPVLSDAPDDEAGEFVDCDRAQKGANRRALAMKSCPVPLTSPQHDLSEFLAAR